MEKAKSNKIKTIKFDLVNSTDSTELFETFDLITLFDVLEHIENDKHALMHLYK